MSIQQLKELRKEYLKATEEMKPIIVRRAKLLKMAAERAKVIKMTKEVFGKKAVLSD